MRWEQGTATASGFTSFCVILTFGCTQRVIRPLCFWEQLMGLFSSFLTRNQPNGAFRCPLGLISLHNTSLSFHGPVKAT